MDLGVECLLKVLPSALGSASESALEGALPFLFFTERSPGEHTHSLEHPISKTTTPESTLRSTFKRSPLAL